ncbi:lytic transglycosylase domain-containing protein [Brevundimonas sp.]|uniref:lytic transglycosylase domain-containing protein n=1 Tax=Brevundimonas sp. TaxID=1871086 RepID=UPI0035112585
MIRRLSDLAARGLVAALLAMLITAGLTTAASAQPRVLSNSDRLSYTNAYDALRRGDLDTARASARQADDRVLLGQVEFERLFHPDHVSSFEELSAWLEEYADLPEAPRVYALALRRRPDGAPEPRRPRRVDGRTWESLTEAEGAKAARIAFNADNLADARATGIAIGDWWVVGLASWRMGDFPAAFTAFERVAWDPTEDAWVRAGAAFWAARSAAHSGQLEQIETLLRLSASWPATFYGQIALYQLDIEPTLVNWGPQPYGATGDDGLRAIAFTPDIRIDDETLITFIERDPQARRVVAWIEVGRLDDAREQFRIGLRAAPTEEDRKLWSALGRAFSRQLTPRARDAEIIDAARYPMPLLEPEGGFVIEQSLVYAIARKETDFNPRVRSGAGAYGLMQVMPTTAAELSGDRGFVSDPERLYQPGVNMRLGQAYVIKMLGLSAFNGDIMRTVASYNAGPGPMLGALRKLGPEADPLLLIETIDVPQARDYVEKVMAAYWIYQRLQGRPLNTLKAVATGQTGISIYLDFVPPPPPAPEGQTPPEAVPSNQAAEQ